MRAKTTAPPDVALLLPSLADGEPQRVALRLARGFARHGLRVDLLVGSASGTFAPDVPSAVRLLDLGAARMRHAVAPLTEYLRRERPACLLSRVMAANFAAVASCHLSERSMRLVIGEDTNLAARIAGGRMPAHLVPAVEWHYRQADTVVTSSQDVAEGLRSLGIASDRLRVIPPTDSDRLLPRYLDVIGHTTLPASRRAA